MSEVLTSICYNFTYSSGTLLQIPGQMPAWEMKVMEEKLERADKDVRIGKRK